MVVAKKRRQDHEAFSVTVRRAGDRRRERPSELIGG